MRILNDAGEFLVNMHNWRWLEGTERSLDLSKDRSYVWLPEDFRELIALQTTDGLNAGIRMTTQRQLAQLRSMSAANSYVYHAAVVHAQRQEFAVGTATVTGVPAEDSTVFINDQKNPVVTFKWMETPTTALDTDTLRHLDRDGTTDATALLLADSINSVPTLFVRATVSGSVVTVTSVAVGTGGNSVAWGDSLVTNISAVNPSGGRDPGSPRPRLDIWPTPTSSSPAGIRVYYRSGWTSVSDEAQMLYLPEWMETLYLFLVRAFARSYEREGDGSVSVRLQDLKAGPLFVSAQQRDKEMTYDIGPMMNGAVHTSNPDPLWNFSSTAGPS